MDVLRVGLTGGIAAGKSTASKQFAALGATVIDYDVLAREAVAADSPGLAAVVARFGTGIVSADGTLNRAAVADQIFADPVARRELEAIIHPEVYRLANELETKAVASHTNVIVVHDIPLLVEENLANQFDVVIAIITDTAIRIKRLIDTRKYTAAQAFARLAAGAKDYQRAEAADLILSGSGTPQELADQVTQIWQLLNQVRILHLPPEPMLTPQGK